MFQGFSKKTGEFLWELAFNNAAGRIRTISGSR